MAFPFEVGVEIPMHWHPPETPLLEVDLALVLQDRILHDQSVKMEVAKWNQAGLQETFPLRE